MSFTENVVLMASATSNNTTHMVCTICINLPTLRSCGVKDDCEIFARSFPSTYSPWIHTLLHTLFFKALAIVRCRLKYVFLNIDGLGTTSWFMA